MLLFSGVLIDRYTHRVSVHGNIKMLEHTRDCIIFNLEIVYFWREMAESSMFTEKHIIGNAKKRKEQKKYGCDVYFNVGKDKLYSLPA